MHNQMLLQDVFTQLVLGNHALDCPVDNLMRVFLEQSPHIVLFQTAEVLSMMSVHFEVLLSTCHMQILGVHNNTDVADVIFLRIVEGLVFAADEDGAHAGHPAQGNSRCVEKMVGLPFVLDCNVARLRVLIRHHLFQASVKEIGMHGVDSVANVGVKGPLIELGLRHKWLCAIDHFAFPFILHAIVTILT